MTVVLALVSALAYGLSDFFGGLVARSRSAWPVAVVVQTCAFLGSVVLALVVDGSPLTGAPPGEALVWGAVGGVGSGAGVGFLFRGLARGRMSLVAPLSAVGAALLPVAAGLILGDRPGTLVGVGVAAAFPGIWLVSRTPDEPVSDGSSGWADGVLAGVGFGTMFAALAQVPESAGLWPLALAQGVSAVAAAVLATALSAPWWPRDPGVWAAAPAGLLSTVALATYLLATQHGSPTVAAVLASLYPAATVLMAVLVLREQVHRTQLLGLLLCGVTVTLVATG